MNTDCSECGRPTTDETFSRYIWYFDCKKCRRMALLMGWKKPTTEDLEFLDISLEEEGGNSE